MSILSPLSANDTAPKALDLFSAPPNNVAVPRYQIENLRPISEFSGVETPLQFETHLQGEYYTDLARSKLFLKVRILKSNGTRHELDTQVTPVNLFFHSMFKKVDLYLNRTLISSSGDLYAYKAYLHAVFNYNKDDKESQLQGELFFGDSPGYFNDISSQGG